MRDTFFTDLDLDSCQQRISALLQRKMTRKEFIFGSKNPVAGWIRENRFYIFKRPYSRNIIVPVYQATLYSDNGGTNLVGKVVFPWTALVLTGFFLLLGAYFIMPICMGLFNDAPISLEAVLTAHTTDLVIAIINLCLAVIMFSWGVFMYFSDGYYLIHYVRKILGS